jgi:glycine cleavage system H protein
MFCLQAASDVYAPISGEVVEVNSVLADEPAKVNSEPFGSGWMMKVKVGKPGELDALLDSSAYEKHCEEGGH